MLAPLLFGTGILLRSIRTNAYLIFPRIGVVVVLLWMLWFANSVVQNTVVYLRRQVRSPHVSSTSCLCGRLPACACFPSRCSDLAELCMWPLTLHDVLVV